MHHPTDRIAHTTAFVTPVVEHWLEREIAQWVHPMKDRSDDPSHHERTLLPRSYIPFFKTVIHLLISNQEDVMALSSHAVEGTRTDASLEPLTQRDAAIIIQRSWRRHIVSCIHRLTVKHTIRKEGRKCFI